MQPSDRYICEIEKYFVLLPSGAVPKPFPARTGCPNLIWCAPRFTRSVEHAVKLLKREFQTELHSASASRADLRTAGGDVGCCASAAETSATAHCGEVIAYTIAIRSAVRIGGNGVIEQVEDLDTELSAVPLLPRERFEYGEIHVLKARVAEDVPANIAKGKIGGGSYDRPPVVGYEAAISREITSVGGTILTQGLGCGIKGSGERNILAAHATSSYAANRASEARAERNGIRSGTEVGGIPVDIPAIREIPTAEIVPEVIRLPRLRGLIVDDGVELPSFQ